MSENNATQIQATAKYLLRGDTEENWNEKKPLLYKREVGLVLDDKARTIGFKIGDGESYWNNLPMHLIRDTEQKFNADSENPMSGKAVAEAVIVKANLEPKQTLVCNLSSTVSHCSSDNLGDFIGYWNTDANMYENPEWPYIVLGLYRNGKSAYLLTNLDETYLTYFNQAGLIKIEGEVWDDVHITVFNDVSNKQDKFADVTEDENTRTIDFNKKFKGIIKNSDGAVSIEAQHISLNSESDFIDVSTARIENLGTPEYYTDAATKGYVDDAIGEINSVLSTLVTIED